MAGTDDSVTRLCEIGLSEHEAWTLAETRFGQTEALGAKLKKSNHRPADVVFREMQFIQCFAGTVRFGTAVLIYLDPPTDFMNWMDGVSRPQGFRNYLFESFGLALPNVHDWKIA